MEEAAEFGVGHLLQNIRDMTVGSLLHRSSAARVKVTGFIAARNLASAAGELPDRFPAAGRSGHVTGHYS